MQNKVGPYLKNFLRHLKLDSYFDVVWCSKPGRPSMCAINSCSVTVYLSHLRKQQQKLLSMSLVHIHSSATVEFVIGSKLLQEQLLCM